MRLPSLLPHSSKRSVFTSNNGRGNLYKLKVGVLMCFLPCALAANVAVATSHSQQMYDAYQTTYQPVITNAQGDEVNNYCPENMNVKTSHPDHVNSIRYNIDCMMTELKGYQNQTATNSLNPYFAYKAQAWLNYAYEEDVEGGSVAARDYAIAQGVAILQALRMGVAAQLERDTDIPANSAMMRPDLWATLMGLKANGAAYITPRELAYAEVKLIWGAAEYCEMGWRHAREHFYASERYLEEASEAFVNAKTDVQSVALQNNIAQLFKLYAPLDPKDDKCNGLALSPNTPITSSLSNTVKTN